MVSNVTLDILRELCPRPGEMKFFDYTIDCDHQNFFRMSLEQELSESDPDFRILKGVTVYYAKRDFEMNPPVSYPYPTEKNEFEVQISKHWSFGEVKQWKKDVFCLDSDGEIMKARSYGLHGPVQVTTSQGGAESSVDHLIKQMMVFRESGRAR